MYWIYVLDCNRFHEYIGKTVKLHSRFWQHVTKQGGANFTKQHKPLKTIAIYKVNHNILYKEYSKNFNKSILRKFYYDNLYGFDIDQESDEFEDEIAIVRNLVSKYKYSDQQTNIRGGQWHQDQEYPELNDECINFAFKRPLCGCGQYTEIECEDNNMFLVCPFKNYFVRKHCKKRRYCNFCIKVSRNNNYYVNQWDKNGYISSYDEESSEEEYNYLVECISDSE